MSNFSRLGSKVEDWLAEFGENSDLFGGLLESAKYSLLNGGKRFRPILCLQVGEILGIKADTLRSYAVAVELIHTASLIHDDLPGLDDAAERRGKPAVHKQFSVAAGILSGDLLIGEAFQVLASDAGVPQTVCCSWIKELAQANSAICSGQLREIEYREKRSGSKNETLAKILEEKTAALIQSAVMGAPLLLGAQLLPEKSAFWRDFGLKLGILFQLRDDVLDGDDRAGHRELGKNLYAELISGLKEHYAAPAELQELVAFVWGRSS